jgi:hypothetical protein
MPSTKGKRVTSDRVDVAGNLARVRETIRAAALEAGRDPAAVTLIAVAKAQPIERIEAALAAGQRIFGENYVQEAAARWPDLRARHPEVELHMIGALQTNKAKEAVGLFDVIQTLDRPKLAGAVAKEAARQNRRLRCFVQVNTGAEPQKAGVMPEAADAFIAECREKHAERRGVDGDPAGRRGHRPAHRLSRQDRPPQRPRGDQHRDERRLRRCGPFRRHACQGRQRHLRRPAAAERS